MADPQIAANTPATPADTAVTATFAVESANLAGAPPVARPPSRSAPFAGDDSLPTAGALLSHPADPTEPGSQKTDAAEPGAPVVPDHDVLERLGAGGFGIVYKARDRKLNRLVAIKLLRGGAFDADMVQRFQREAEAMAQLDHPHIVPVYARGEHLGEPYFAMQFMAGGSLAQRKEELQRDPRSCIAVLAKVARAVHYLHERKFLHRDLKLRNILFAEDGEPHVSDFGLAKWLDSDLELTGAGERLGTLPYMAPEQLTHRGADLGPSADIWALGIMLYELLSGHRPFASESKDTLRQQILTQELPPLQLVQARPLEPVLAKCLAKEPRDRFASAGELADELERWLRDEPLRTQPKTWRQRALSRIRRRPRVAIGLVALLALALGAAAVGYLNRPQRAADAMQQDLRAGRTVSVFHKDQSPRWQRVSIGPATVKAPHGKDAAVALQAHNLGILEILPATGIQAFRMTAEVRHDDQGDRLTTAGIVIGLRVQETPAETRTQFLAFGFNDLERMDDERDNAAPARYWIVRAGKNPGTELQTDHHRVDSRPLFAPKGLYNGAGSWRTLEVTVTPELLTLRFDEILVVNLTRDEVDKHLALAQRVWNMPDAAVAFDPTGGIGLMIDRGEAAFRNVRLEPLNPAK